MQLLSELALSSFWLLGVAALLTALATLLTSPGRRRASRFVTRLRIVDGRTLVHRVPRRPRPVPPPPAEALRSPPALRVVR